MQPKHRLPAECHPLHTVRWSAQPSSQCFTRRLEDGHQSSRCQHQHHSSVTCHRTKEVYCKDCRALTAQPALGVRRLCHSGGRHMPPAKICSCLKSQPGYGHQSRRTKRDHTWTVVREKKLLPLDCSWFLLPTLEAASGPGHWGLGSEGVGGWAARCGWAGRCSVMPASCRHKADTSAAGLFVMTEQWTCQFLHRCLAGRGESGRWGAWALGKSSACLLCLHDTAWPGLLPSHHLTCTSGCLLHTSC